jgi:hypothetical protein
MVYNPQLAVAISPPFMMKEVACPRPSWHLNKHRIKGTDGELPRSACLGERDAIELIEHRLVESLDDAIRLWALGLGTRMASTAARRLRRKGVIGERRAPKSFEPGEVGEIAQARQSPQRKES